MRGKLQLIYRVLICLTLFNSVSMGSDESTLIDWGEKPTIGTIIRDASGAKYHIGLFKFGIEGYILV